MNFQSSKLRSGPNYKIEDSRKIILREKSATKPIAEKVLQMPFLESIVGNEIFEELPDVYPTNNE